MMKKTMTMLMLLASVLWIQSCTTDSDDSWLDDVYGDVISGGVSAGGATAGSGELTSFTVAIDKTSAEPATTVGEYFPEEEDNLANNTFDTEVTIAFDGNTATCSAADGVTITTDGAHVVASHGSTKGVSYVLSGTTTNGSLTILGSKKYEVRLNGVSITNPDSTALNLLSSKRAYVVLADGTTNMLADGTTSKASDQKAALYCKGKLLFNGSGALEVYGNYNNGIHSADYIVFRTGNNVYVKSTANHGIKANDGIFINGGILNVEVSALAAKGINSESNIIVNGGRTTVVTTGNGTYDADDKDVKGSAGIKADSTYTQNGGEVYLKSTGSGGKGLKTDYEAYLNGGSLYVITEGTRFTSNSDTASPKGIKIGTKNVHGLLNVSGGTTMVRTKGNGGEGVESKGTITISGGTVEVSAYDDAVNSAGDMTIMGGDIVAVGTANDGLDANGNMYIQGGNIVAFGASGAETGIDIGEQYKLYITGGNIFGIGGRIDANLGSTTQGIVSTSGTVSANGTVSVSDGSSTLFTFTMPPYGYSNGTIMLSTPGMASGSSYTLTLGTSSQTVTASSTLSSSMGGGGMQPGGGGGRPGGW
ncbi:MAG: carbohydrate-binding domain-containing protein [Prevotella sp.]|nr:carbohydrate-binding domain-containing protein [Prevotella sp.]